MIGLVVIALIVLSVVVAILWLEVGYQDYCHRQLADRVSVLELRLQEKTS